MTKCGPNEFKEKLDSYLTLIPDEPKMPGLIPGATTSDAVPSNSLLWQIPRAMREGLTAAWSAV